MILQAKIISLAAVLLILLAYRVKSYKSWHVSLMATAFCIDLGLVLFLEYNRHVIPKAALAREPLHPLLSFHIAVAVLTLLLYVAQMGLGIFQGMRPYLLRVHRKSGMVFMSCRVATLVTSLWVDRFIH